MNRHLFSGSKTNRSRREQSYARWAIAEAQRRHLASTEVVEEHCLYCTVPLTTRDHHPYCSAECGVIAELDLETR